MALYKILFDQDVDKDLSKIPKEDIKRMLKKCLALGDQPWPQHSLKLLGAGSIYRLRVGSYRIIYTIDDEKKIVTVFHIRHRKDVYRRF